MSKERDTKMYTYAHLCMCGEISDHQLDIQKGLSGTKAQGFCKCPHCNTEVYMKIYLDTK